MASWLRLFSASESDARRRASDRNTKAIRARNSSEIRPNAIAKISGRFCFSTASAFCTCSTLPSNCSEPCCKARPDWRADTSFCTLPRIGPMFCSNAVNCSRSLPAFVLASPSRRAAMPSASEPDSNAFNNSRKSLVSLPIKNGTSGSMISAPRISAEPRPNRSARKVRRLIFNTCAGGAPDCCIKPVKSCDSAANSSAPARTCEMLRDKSTRSFFAARMEVADDDWSANRLVNSTRREVNSSLACAVGTFAPNASPPLFSTSR